MKAKMENDAAVENFTLTLARAFGDMMRKITASATVNRGVCAGSVSFLTKPESTVSEVDVMCLVKDAYAANGQEIDLDSPEGIRLFFKIVLEAAKQIVSTNRAVNFVDRLRYEARLYSDDAKTAWMCPIACSKEFNRLPSEVDLAESPAFLAKKKRAAKRKPFDHAAAAERVGRVTTVTCPNCGTPITIENSEK